MSTTKILIFIDWFYPAYKAGGPLKSVFNLVQALKKEFDFSIVTSNRDLDGEILEVVPNEWSNYEGIDVIYLTKEKQKRKIYRAIFEEKKVDVVYYNSLFSLNFLLKPYRLFKQYEVKQVICPRGMFGEGSLAVKAKKKKVFLSLAKRYIFDKKQTIWHATSEQEAKDIEKNLGRGIKVVIAQNLSSQPINRDLSEVTKVKNELKLVFIARVLPIKNLLFALELIQELKEEKGLTLDIYGPIEEETYWKKCKAIIERDDRIQYRGVVKPQDIATTLQQYHFYILPTLHENYGHSIVEALLAGLPIVISQATPWSNLKLAGVGADLDMGDKAEWMEYLKEALALTQDDYEQMVQNCYAYVEEHILSAKTIEDARKVFKN